ncbi:nucleotide exchange factor SIL1-like [Sycon ciliatum]|uniref:nucleotide exchange factor SIL1-like n=1 Tax=Sycon ciliatum TaxID=27933 RepID=UPI0031F70E52
MGRRATLSMTMRQFLAARFFLLGFLWTVLVPAVLAAEGPVDVSSLAAVDVDPDSESGAAEGEASVNTDTTAPATPRRVLQPTSEWQTVEDDMSIPPGLHVRMDLQTGKKEAKLLDPEDAEASSQDSRSVTADIQVPRDLREGIVNTKRMVFTPEQAAEQLADGNHEESSSPDSARPGIAYDTENTVVPQESIDDIARKYAQARKKVKQIQPRADAEVMQALVNLFNNITTPEEQRLTILEELEYFVHQIDNARDLEAIGGMDIVLRALKHSDAKFRSVAALILGSAMQGNPSVQQTVLHRGVLPTLVQFLQSGSQEPKTVRRPAMFALSALVRSHAEAQRRLWELDGLHILKDLCRTSAEDHIPALCVKSVTLIYDILTEQADVNYVGSAEERLLPRLEASQWCDSVISLLSSSDGDVLEKAVGALQAMVPACGNHLTQNTNVLQQLSTLEQHWREQSQANDDDTDQYFASMQETTHRLHVQLVDCATHSNCTSGATAADSTAHEHAHTTDL